MFVQYHSEASLKDLFQGHFKIIVLEEYAEFDEGDSILLIAEKRSL